MNFHISNALDVSGRITDLYIESGEIVASPTKGASFQKIDATGLTVLPGFVDLHTHLREPGREDAETVLSGSRAASAGGFTAISAMPNTLPVADTAGVVEQVFRLGQSHNLCDVFSHWRSNAWARGKTSSRTWRNESIRSKSSNI